MAIEIPRFHQEIIYCRNCRFSHCHVATFTVYHSHVVFLQLWQSLLQALGKILPLAQTARRTGQSTKYLEKQLEHPNLLIYVKYLYIISLFFLQEVLQMKLPSVQIKTRIANLATPTAAVKVDSTVFHRSLNALAACQGEAENYQMRKGMTSVQPWHSGNSDRPETP